MGDYYYTGSEITPKAYVLLDGMDITDSVDLTYKNNKKVGTASVIASGTENYTGTATGTFAIHTQNLNQVKISKIGKQTYTGKAIKPGVTLTNNGNKLKKNTDYTISYKNNKKPGIATITIKSKGKQYTGKLTLKFKIAVAKPKNVKATVKADGSLKITAKRPSTKARISGYQICLREKGTSAWTKHSVDCTDKLNQTLTDLTAGKRYQVRVRCYLVLNGKKKYGSYSSILTTAPIK